MITTIKAIYPDDVTWFREAILISVRDGNNAVKEEPERDSVVAKFATTAADGKTYKPDHYN